MKNESNVVVVHRKLNRAKTGAALNKQLDQYKDPSFECEKAQNPLDYVKTSYSKAMSAKLLFGGFNLSARHIRELFGEPTRICQSHLEYVLQIPTREIVKIVVDSKGAVTIHGFQRTQTLEKWVNRLVHA